VEGFFDIQNIGSKTEELEVALETLNGNPLFGHITFLEAKHGILGWCCSFLDLENFDKFRF
jgi:hypothetical protein